MIAGTASESIKMVSIKIGNASSKSNTIGIKNRMIFVLVHKTITDDHLSKNYRHKSGLNPAPLNKSELALTKTAHYPASI